MSQTFRIRAKQTVFYEVLVEADTIEEAVEAVESELETDLYEVDNTSFTVEQYAVDGQAGWNDWPN